MKLVHVLLFLLAHYIFMWLSFFLSSHGKGTKVKFAKRAQEAKDEGRRRQEEKEGEEDGARSVSASWVGPASLRPRLLPFHTGPDLGFMTLGLRESGCRFALSTPTVGRKTQICTLIHTNLESQIPSLHRTQQDTAIHQTAVLLSVKKKFPPLFQTSPPSSLRKREAASFLVLDKFS